MRIDDTHKRRASSAGKNRSKKEGQKMTRHYLLLLLFPVVVLGAPRFIRRDGGIPNQYIVVLRAETPSEAVAGIVNSLEASYGVRSAVTWEYSIKGFLAIATEQQATAMLEDPRVDYIEQDIPGAGLTAGVENTWDSTGTEYLWHLDRLDDLSYAGRDSTYNKCPVGSSVYAYVIDTGVWNGHSEFDNRLVLQLDFSADQPNQSQPHPPDDTNACITANQAGGWHGTAVASLLAGNMVGAAETKIVSLKIAQCNTSGTPGFSAATLVSALNWINNPTKNEFRSSPGVINFSGLLFDFDVQGYPSVTTALTNTITQTGFPFFTSADNFSSDACFFFPNNLAYTNSTKTNRHVFVVGGTSVAGDNLDYRFQNWTGCPSSCQAAIGQDSGSNGGLCVSAYAPAVAIYAARNTGPSSYARAPGTSFSSPLAAGLAARYIEQRIAQTGFRPSYTAVYDFLLNSGQVVPQWMQTAPTYWMCVYSDPNTLEVTTFPFPTTRESCPQGWHGPYVMQSANNDGVDENGNPSPNARMLYWPSTCP